MTSFSGQAVDTEAPVRIAAALDHFALPEAPEVPAGPVHTAEPAAHFETPDWYSAPESIEISDRFVLPEEPEFPVHIAVPDRFALPG